MQKRLRVGVKTNFPFGLFPNAGIFVVYIKETDVERFLDAFTTVRGILYANGQGAIADRFVCEVS